MPYNLKKTRGATYPVKIDGKVINLTEEQIGEAIKQKMRSNPVIMSAFDNFDVSPEYLDKLHIQIVDLEGRYAETDGDQMSIGIELAQSGRLLSEDFYILVHEIWHFLNRTIEERSYMNDHEEREAFVLAAAYMLSEKMPMDFIWNELYDKISFHFHDPSDAQLFLINCLKRAKKIL